MLAHLNHQEEGKQNPPLYCQARLLSDSTLTTLDIQIFTQDNAPNHTHEEKKTFIFSHFLETRIIFYVKILIWRVFQQMILINEKKNDSTWLGGWLFPGEPPQLLRLLFALNGRQRPQS